MRDLSTYPETVASLRRAIEYAPRTIPAPAEGLLGWWTPDGAFVCATCAGRVMARGCALPRGSEACWKEQPFGVCCTCPSDQLDGGAYMQDLSDGELVVRAQRAWNACQGDDLRKLRAEASRRGVRVA
jgi:hypothetical protein